MSFIKPNLVFFVVTEFIYSSNYVKGTTVSYCIPKTGPISFSYEIKNMNKLYLDINVPDLENFDFEHPLTNSMKEQLVIYNLFVEQFLWLSYLNNLFFKSSIASIAEKLKIRNRSCSFAKHYNISLMKGCSDIFYFFCDKNINIVNLHEMCLIKLQNGRFYYVQKDLSSKKDQNLSLYLITDYYKKRLFKIFNGPSEFICNLKREIRFLLSNPEKVEFSNCSVSVKAFDNLVNYAYLQFYII